MTKIKICGLTREEDIQAVNEYLPDYIGFVFAKSKRQLHLEKAKYLKGMLSKEIQSVGVFVNEPLENLIRYEKEKVIDMIQLHGDEDEEYILALKAKVKLPIIKAVRVKKAEDLTQCFDVDFLLFDKYLEGAYGGGGERFDWQIIGEAGMRYFLAGGVNIDNIHEALQKRPYAIDISSGAETNGVKDAEKIRDIIRKVREENEV